ncbi:MAG TPA: hypothetical protein VHB02_18440 [Acidimicrobiales bacterium]|nr:hypothetical protein [Acidimicrobiales bacterium]
MFVPDDLSLDEEALVATMRRQMIERRQPQDEAERQAAISEADQVAAETIQEARARTWVEEAPEEPETENERWWREFRQGVASLDRSSGSISEVMAMEDEGASYGDWLPVQPSSPPSAP